MLHLTSNNKQFPEALKHIPGPPRELFIEGNWANLMDKPKVAIVGSRKASPYGRIVTQRLVQALSAYGVVIVSGLALGIDSIAHQAALDANGLTIAVLPSGTDNVYPASHRSLAKQIVDRGGALLSEYPPKTESYKTNFIARNRLIAGLSQAVIITEAAEHSGSLHTANFAIEQGKDVLVVPGPITSPTSVGCNNLIKTGAAIITNPADVLNAINIQRAEYQILKLIKDGIKDGDELQIKSGLTAARYLEVMSFLEITGKIKVLGGNQWDII
jgi:DNA processing protein